MSQDAAARTAGRLLVTGFDGPELSARTREALRRGERAGCILFKRNLDSAEQTRALTASIQAASASRALVAIDEEGGRVSRLPAGEARLPPMRMLGVLGDAELVFDAGRAIGARLFQLGFNLDFAPILDVDSNPANPVIGDRSFGASPERVAQLAVAFARGLNAGGVLSCGKHFPGHGDTDKDSHFDLPVIRHDRARLDRVELLPFRAASAHNMDSIMSAHVVIEALEPGEPATFSKRAMTDLLRGELGFQGVLVSDDLEMRAVSARCDAGEAALRAVRAGCDLLLVCKSEDEADRAHAALVAEIAASSAFAARAEEAGARVDRMRARAAELAMRGPQQGADLEQVLSRIADAGASLGRPTVIP